MPLSTNRIVLRKRIACHTWNRRIISVTISVTVNFQTIKTAIFIRHLTNKYTIIFNCLKISVLICLPLSQFIKIERKYILVVCTPPESTLQTIWTNGNWNKEKGCFIIVTFSTNIFWQMSKHCFRLSFVFEDIS